jgi:hypothetical protein
MHKYVLKKKFADFMGLEANKPYVEDFIKLKIIEKCFSVADIKKFMPRFKGCSCKQTICQNNSLTFYSYILENYMENLSVKIETANKTEPVIQKQPKITSALLELVASRMDTLLDRMKENTSLQSELLQISKA